LNEIFPTLQRRQTAVVNARLLDHNYISICFHKSYFACKKLFNRNSSDVIASHDNKQTNDA